MLRVIWRALLRRERWERDLDDELAAHVEARAADLVRRGAEPTEAARQARRELGPTDRYKEQCREAHGLRWVDELRQDLLYSARVLRRYPAFTVLAIASLALGIGANTVVCSVIDRLLLRPLPVVSPEQIAAVNHRGGPAHSFPNYRDIRDRNDVFSSLFAYRITHLSLGLPDRASRVWGLLVTGNYFETLGVQPAVGRFFGPQDDLHTDGSPWVVLSYDCWQKRFGGDPSIPGSTVHVNGRPYTVLGVASQGFHGIDAFYWPELWLPMSMQPQVEGASWLETRSTFNAWVAGRLKPGVTMAQANANLATIAAALAAEDRVNDGIQLTVSPPGLAGAALRGPAAVFAAGVMLLAALVLLASCLNIATLLSARLADRTRELAIRLAIGAGRGRLVRQLLTESLVLAGLGGIGGAALAVLLLRLLSLWQAPLDFPVRFDVTPDAGVLAFALAAAALAAVLVGTVPALRAWGTALNDAMKPRDDGPPGRRWAMRDVLLGMQVALCCVLITATFVALRGTAESLRVPLGLRPEGAVMAGFDLHLGGYDEQRGRVFHRRVHEAVCAIPGVTSCAVASSIPLNINQSNTRVYAKQTADFRAANQIRAFYYRVSPGYFATMGTTLVAGREFNDADSTGPLVAIVNETFVERVLEPGDPIGQRFRYGPDDVAEVIGVVEDGKYVSLTEEPVAAVFQPLFRHYSRAAVAIARSSRPEASVAADIHRVMAELDPNLPLYATGSLTHMLRFVHLPVNAALVALGAFGVLAVMLAVTGIYGLSSYTVARRVREIGIRLAVGARPGDVVTLVSTRTAVVVTAGLMVGLPAGVIAARVLGTVMPPVSPHDPLVIAGVCLTVAVIALGAIAGPLRRALRVDPATVLRVE